VGSELTFERINQFFAKHVADHEHAERRLAKLEPARLNLIHGLPRRPHTGSIAPRKRVADHLVRAEIVLALRRIRSVQNQPPLGIRQHE
jgi:hypothetical protein